MPTIVFADFEWDDAKAAANEIKHGVSFYEAAWALTYDLGEVTYGDLDNSDRTLSLVMSGRVRVLLVVTTERGPRIRIISARKASTHEERIYQRGS